MRTVSGWEGWRIEARWGEVAGRWEAVQVLLSHPDGVRSTRLKQVPLGEVLRAARPAPKDLPALDVVKGPHRGRGHSASDLEAVAEVYRDAYQRGAPVQGAVARAFGIPLSTAAKRIMAARRSGFLPARSGR